MPIRRSVIETLIDRGLSPAEATGSEGHRARAGHRPAAVGARWRAQSHRRVSYAWHSRPAAGTTSTTQGAGNVGPSYSSQNFPCAPCVSRGRSPPRPRWRTTSRPTTVILSCSTSGSCSRCVRTATAAARNSSNHTVTSSTSGLMVGRSIRTIRRISLALKGGRARPGHGRHVDGCWRAPRGSTRSPCSFLWAEGGISKNPGRPRCRPPRTSRVRVIKKMIMLAKTLGRNFRGQKF